MCACACGCVTSTSGGSAGPVCLPCFAARSQEKEGSSSGQESFSSKNAVHLFNLKPLPGTKYVEGGEGERETEIQHLTFFLRFLNYKNI